VPCINCRENKRDGLNIICSIANHHADILCVPAELHVVNEAVILEVDFLYNFLHILQLASFHYCSVVSAVIPLRYLSVPMQMH